MLCDARFLPPPGLRSQEVCGDLMKLQTRIRVPFAIKVMASYVLVVGLIALPTGVYWSQHLEKTLYASWTQRLQRQAEALAVRLSEVPRDEVADTVWHWHSATGTDIALLDPKGRLIARSGETDLDTRRILDRPETRAVLHGGASSAIGPQRTPSAPAVYVARSLRANGHPEALLHLRKRVPEISSLLESTRAFLEQAAAVALTAAVLLSALAAFVFVRPLREFSQTIRAVADGNLDYPVSPRIRGELTDAAAAFRDLVARLRETLVRTGSKDSSLASILDAVPCGVIWYRADGSVRWVSGPGRVIAQLTPTHESDRAQKIRSLCPPPDEAASAPAKPEPICLPWAPDRSISVRWVTVFGGNGGKEDAAIFTRWPVDEASVWPAQELEDAIQMLLRLAPTADAELALEAEECADALRYLQGLRIAASSRETQVTDLSPVLSHLPEGATTRAAARRITLSLSGGKERLLAAVPEPVAQAALHRTLIAVTAAARSGATVRIRGEAADADLRIVFRFDGAPPAAQALPEIWRALGIHERTQENPPHIQHTLFFPKA